MTPNPAPQRSGRSTSKRLVHAALLGLSVIGAMLPCALASDTAASSTGVITGIVTNRTTGNGLEGARVEIPSLSLGTLVDQTGRYVLNGVPAGAHEIVVSYSGLDPGKSTVNLTAGQRAVRDFDLTSAVYMLDAFKVAGEKEGAAAAITAQRNADNLKNVASMDSFGNLRNLGNATEIALRLPGVTVGTLGDEVVETVSVRGMGTDKTTINIDGGFMSSIGANLRRTRMTGFTGGMFESIEVIKGLTPDIGADSLGGAVNLKTRSPLSMREKRRIGYTFSARHAPWFTEQIPMRDAHRTHPIFNISYQEKFGIFGSSEANLAVAVNLFYTENVLSGFRTDRDYQQTNNTPAYVWDYRTQDTYNNRTQQSLNIKWDYRLSARTLLKMNFIYNEAPEQPQRRLHSTRAFAGNATTVPSATSGIVPGFTDRITTVRAVPTAANATSSTVPAAAIDVSQNLGHVVDHLRHVNVAGEHTYGALEIDWAGVWSRTRRRQLGSQGALTHRIGGVPFIGPNGLPGSATNTIRGPNGETGVGWILDRTESDLYPRFIQNGGLDFTNPDNYRPTVNGLTTTSGNLEVHLVRSVRANAKYKLPFVSFTAFLKTGADIRRQIVLMDNRNRRWSYLGRDALPADPTILLWDKVKTGRNIPTWEAAPFIRNGQPTNPALWQEDKYFHESNKYSASYSITETVLANYIMTQGTFGRNGFLAGVRSERVDTGSWSWTRERVATTAAQQLADPVGSAQKDYAGNLREISGRYEEPFPSVHLWRNITRNVKGRLSWSTSSGRPSMVNALPTETVNEANQTLSIGNPALLPQKAKNWDASLEYYFEPSGSLSIGWFHKTIGNYIVTGQETGTIASGPDNGYDGEYSGFRTLQSANAGTAVAQGWELSYLQQFRFLPGIWKGISLNANYTVINTHGDFGTKGAYYGNNQVPGFIPKTANISLSWNHRKFGTRFLWNYTSESIRAFTAGQPSRNQFMLPRELVNVGVTYQLRPNLTFQLDVANLFNEPQRFYRGIPDQMEHFLIQGTTITVGVEGRF